MRTSCPGNAESMRMDGQSSDDVWILQVDRALCKAIQVHLLLPHSFHAAQLQVLVDQQMA